MWVKIFLFHAVGCFEGTTFIMVIDHLIHPGMILQVSLLSAFLVVNETFDPSKPYLTPVVIGYNQE